VIRSGWIARWREELFAGMASGFLLALSFPPFPTRFFAAVALVPLFRYYLVRNADAMPGVPGSASVGRGHAGHVTREQGVEPKALRARLKRGFVLGFILGASFFATLLFWIVKLIPASGVTMPWVLGPGLALLVAYLSCYTALTTGALSFLISRLGVRALWAAPALWSLAEFARSHGELGFSWGILANALAIHPVAIQGVSFYGSFGLSFVLVLVNLLIAQVVFAGSRRGRLGAALAVIVIAGGHMLWGKAEIERFDRTKVSLSPTENVAIAQPNVDLGLKWDAAYRDSIFHQMETFSVRAAARGARLIIFPETAAPVSFKASPEYLGRLEYIARTNKIDILTGYVDHTRRNDTWVAHNAAAIIRDNGMLTDNYHKVNLLPFGEKMPFSQYLPFLSKPDFGQANFIAGTKQTLFGSSAGTFGVLICFESTFAGFTRRYVQDGADFLVNITNDGWFGSSRGPIQHAEMAILRSVENRVTLFRAAYTGVSMVVDPVGRVHERLGLFTEGMIYGAAERSAKPSVYTKRGETAYLAMVIANLALVCIPPMLKNRSRRS
jgi:apolipoprotein N-acyltransferase